MYKYAPAAARRRPTAPRAQVLASGVAMPWALSAQRLLAEDWGVAADVWSVTSWTELRRDALACESHNLLHPGDAAADAVRDVGAVRLGSRGRSWRCRTGCGRCPTRSPAGCRRRRLTRRWGRTGSGFSDTRPAARRFFHVDAESITLAVLAELARSGQVDASLPAQAIAKYKLDLPVSEALG